MSSRDDETWFPVDLYLRTCAPLDSLMSKQHDYTSASPLMGHEPSASSN